MRSTFQILSLVIFFLRNRGEFSKKKYSMASIFRLQIVTLNGIKQKYSHRQEKPSNNQHTQRALKKIEINSSTNFVGRRAHL